jgi:hypothetical protein
MPFTEEGRIYRNPQGKRPPSKQQNGASVNHSSAHEELGCLESLIWIILFFAGIVALGFGLYWIWQFMVWAYGVAIKILRFIYEFKEIIAAFGVWIVFGIIRSLFD